MLRSMTAAARPLAASTARVALALVTLYLVWGSTYLGIRIMVGSIPPLLGSGIRFLAAGSILYVLAGRRAGGLVVPGRAEWRDAAVIGAFLLVGGNGLLAIGETTVASGIAALIIATMPLWVAVIGRLFFGMRLAWLTAGGIAIGLAGVAVLVWPTGGVAGIDPRGALLVMGSPILWAIGSLYSRGARHTERPLLGVAMQMLWGGIFLTLLAIALGELAAFRPASLTTDSVVAAGYLILVGSLVGYSAYGWLLRVAPLPLISTYAYVNPIVAVLLGATFLGEPVTPRTLLAGVIIVAAVAVIVWARSRESAASAPDPDELVEAA